MIVGLIRRIQRLSARKIIWSRPRRQPVLLIDPSGIDTLTQFVSIEDIEVLDLEETNIWVFARTILKRQLSTTAYAVAYIETTRPKVVMTFIDNDVNFYKLKNLCPKTKFVAIQNGVRANYSGSPSLGFFDQLSVALSETELSSDYYCAFGAASARQLTPFIQTKMVTVGSLKNNLFAPSESNRNAVSDVVFISQYPPFSVRDTSRRIYFGNKFIALADFYRIESTVAKLIAQYCSVNHLSLTICGKRDAVASDEQKFFADSIGLLPWSYEPRSSTYSTYETANAAKIVVSVDSTVGQEFLARGKRVAFMSGRTQAADPVGLAQVRDTNFGYPLDLSPTGKFWTNQATTTELTRILDYLQAVTDEEWATEIAPYNESLMAYQPGNPVFKKLLLDLGLTLIDGVKSDA
jgi:surface carbohydrate biosynthesis protein